MNKKILLIVPVLALVGGLYFFLQQESMGKFEQIVTKENSKDFQDFLYENHEKFIKLAITLSPDIAQSITRGRVEDNMIEFTAPDANNPNQKVKYRIRLMDDGLVHFDFDKSKGRISGDFITHRGVSSDGSPILNLIPLSPSNLKKHSKIL